MAKNYDFSGWATKNDLRCSDGRTIRKDAFKENDGQTVPLVWNHQHNDSENILGHALLENRPNGVYAYCSFNDTERGQNAKRMVEHGDITGLSIYANKLKQTGGDVLHGAIREVSLVLCGANPGAFIDTVLTHGDGIEEEGVIYTGENLNLKPENENSEDKNDQNDNAVKHAETEDLKPDPKSVNEENNKENKKMDPKEKTVQEVVDSMTEEQKNVMYALVGMAVEDAKKGDEAKHSDENKEDEMKHNVFENEQNEENTLQHAEIQAALADGKRYGSLKDSFLAHGIEDIEYLFPENKNINGNGAPSFIRNQPSAWVDVVMKGVHRTPFSRIKMMFADITEDEARAKGYLKGNYKKEEMFSLIKRTINPTTVYKKQKLDRDDVVDITDFDVIAWIKGEMRMMLDEELARAFMFGDGRSASSDDKINETNIIPVLKDTTNNFYAMEKTVTLTQGESVSHGIIRTMVKAQDDYEGSGNITLFIKQGLVSDMLLMEDTQGYRLYKSINELADAMQVAKIVKVPAALLGNDYYGIALDLNDYNVGADKGGAVNMFDDFDIDYNAQKYLIETRCSGGLTQPHSAIVLKASA